MKISEIILLLERDGWKLKRVSGSHRHFVHPAKPGLVTVARGTRPETEALMIEAMAAHIGMLREAGQPVPEPSEAASVVILDPAAA
jgi:predicted RNA binding protein YcfA (HicA-like mRNA interferase family)